MRAVVVVELVDVDAMAISGAVGVAGVPTICYEHRGEKLVAQSLWVDGLVRVEDGSVENFLHVFSRKWLSSLREVVAPLLLFLEPLE